MYQEGCEDKNMVKAIQEALHIPMDGVFGKMTTRAVVDFQRTHNLVADGIVGKNTLLLLGILDSDLRLSSATITQNIVINKYFMRKDEYLMNQVPGKNQYIFLHHTAGNDNPYQTIDIWNNDDRGPIGTEFAIGGKNIKNGSDKYDGVITQAYPANAYAYHLGAVQSSLMIKYSVGIELCNYGFLTDAGVTYTKIKALEDQIATLKEPFRGYSKWHKYSDKQLSNLKQLLLFIANRDSLDVRKGLIETINTKGVAQAFAFNPDAVKGSVKGLLTHGNVRKDKFDVFPQEELIDMLLSI
jgi:hypothetical protein